MEVLPIQRVRDLAVAHQYNEIGLDEQSRLISFRHVGTNSRINVYYTTGTVATCIDHPRSGKTQLFRRNMSLLDLETIFRNPRSHTGVGYYYTRQTNGDSWRLVSDQSVGRKAKTQRREECDDARRWRYVAAATGFCSDRQATQIAALCELWKSIQNKPGITKREHAQSMSDDLLASYAAAGIHPRTMICSDDNCTDCSAHAGSYCTLTTVLASAAKASEGALALVKRRTGEDPVILGLDDVSSCPCREGIAFQRQYHQDLERLKNQFRSFPRSIRRELLVWFASKYVDGCEFLVLKEDGLPEFMGEAFCSNEILSVHHEYGNLAYNQDYLSGNRETRGCPCHGF